MNYLAHAHLSGSDLRAEGICGDFVKGRLSSISDPALRLGVCLHRRIDSYTDRHPVCLRSRRRFGPDRRRFAGVITDVVFDHFLASEWHRYSPHPLRAFADGVYRELEDKRDRLPERLRTLVPRMVSEDWLVSYRELGVIEGVLDRISTRSARAAPLRGAGGEIEANYHGLRADFLAFFPELVAFAAAERCALLSSAPPGGPIESGDE